MINYHVVRSTRRKTLSLQVKQGKVLVRAPHFVDDNYISNLVANKSAWLRKKIAEQAQVGQQSCQFKQGDKLLLLGETVCLQVCFAKKSTVFLSTSTNLVNSSQPSEHTDAGPVLKVLLPFRYQDPAAFDLQPKAVKKYLEQYLKQQALDQLPIKVERFSELTQLIPKSIKIRQYSARWGSCNNRKELSFNYLMMMLPDEVIDYVVIHELCHLRFLNHSADFWSLVEKYCPDYLQMKLWLKVNQAKLSWRLP